MKQLPEETNIENRRPIQSRGNPLIQKFAAYLAKKSHPTPNEISCLSAIFAALGAICLVIFPYTHFSFLLICVIFIQLRLLCNLLDGMVAIEGGKKTAIGDIFNEFPDRIADSLLLIALGYASQLAWLGWLAALLAMMTAYIRVFGGSLGFSQSFMGPMAKQHRMAVLTISCLLSILEISLWQTYYSLSIGLGIITLGSAYTCFTRTMYIINQLQQKNR
ncbi:MAG: CDP-alcohol phosphatidyltransferase family protein [Lonepinella koalarum]|nr:CDP-alcohol phosphatidyltransferase family protein [Lonepinella koalarum]